jgi:hypothetical protein
VKINLKIAVYVGNEITIALVALSKQEACWLSMTGSCAPLHAAARLDKLFPVIEAEATPKISHTYLATSFYFLIATNAYLSNAPIHFLIDALVMGKINSVSRLLRQEFF